MTEDDLEGLAFHYANSPAVPAGAQELIRELWRRYCLATTPANSKPGRVASLTGDLIKRERPALRVIGTCPDHPGGCP